MRPWESVPATTRKEGCGRTRSNDDRSAASPPPRSFAPARPDRAAQERLRAAERALLVGGPGARYIRSQVGLQPLP
jgi:hypothetical protein